MTRLRPYGLCASGTAEKPIGESIDPASFPVVEVVFIASMVIIGVAVIFVDCGS